MMAYLGDAHGVSAARIGVTGIGDNTALGRGGVGYQTLWTLASGLPLLGNTHGPGTTGVGVTGIPPGCRGVIGGQGSRRGRGSLSGAGIGAAIKAAEAPVRAVEVRHPDRPAGGVTASALVSSEGRGQGTRAQGGGRLPE